MHILNDPSFFLTNKTGAPQGEELGLMNHLSESSFSCSNNSFISDGANRYGARATGVAPGIKSICNSIGLAGGRPSKSSKNTSGKSPMIGDNGQQPRFTPFYLRYLLKSSNKPSIAGKVSLPVVATCALLVHGHSGENGPCDLGPSSPIGFLLTSPHIVDLGYILLLKGFWLCRMLSPTALGVLTTQPACHSSLVLCLSSLGESLPSIPGAYGQTLEALISQPAASENEPHTPGAVSE
ncbi:hypothetical protein Tco_0562126 [Tanacetum coccineum]